MIHKVLIINSSSGKVRLKKDFICPSSAKLPSLSLTPIEIMELIRKSSNACEIIGLPDVQIIYRQYASLYFILIASLQENSLALLDLIHMLVERMNLAFNMRVTELDIVYHFEKVYEILDDVVFGGLV
ncbi:hypothetical protein MP638_006906 [Amoeboaphelidium occidentale]|nr:hypothetical protein MP638_006906 [Amoeboaphelidium occidentale]